MDIFNWDVQLQNGLSGKFSLDVKDISFGDGYNSQIENGMNSESQEWSIEFTEKEKVALEVFEFIRNHCTKSFIWKTPIGERLFFRVKADSFEIKPLSSKVFSVTATFKRWVK